MLVTVEIAGCQYSVNQNDIVTVPLLHGEPGQTVEFDKILLSDNNGDTTFGTPYLDGKVTAKIIEHFKDAKVIVFHKKRRKGYRKLNGHRQRFSNVEITSIELN